MAVGRPPGGPPPQEGDREDREDIAVKVAVLGQRVTGLRNDLDKHYPTKFQVVMGALVSIATALSLVFAYLKWISA